MALASEPAGRPAPVLEGPMLVLAGFVLAMANFMAVLDISIANVALPHIAGALAASPNEGTSVITFFAVAEAISIPLTGWLAQRFGSVRVFLVSMAGFGLTSAFCGLAVTLPMLVTFRILQGLFAGPMMPLSQALLTQIVPRKHYPMAIGLWTMTVIVAPIAGPLLGGAIADTIGWEWAFYINVAPAVLSVLAGWWLLTQHETPTRKVPVDFVGLALLIIWVGALQTMLDGGAEHDWFESPYILSLLALSLVGFAAFMIWELTDPHPIVDLKVFRYPRFSIATTVISLTFAIFFASLVLIPLWLQTNMGYTASWAGNLMAFNGVLGFFAAPLVSKLMVRFDPRAVAFTGLLGIAAVMFWRTFFNSQITFAEMVPVQLVQGAFMPLFFIPLMALALFSIDKKELASASGMLTFARTIAGAVGASVATTMWTNQASVMRSEVVSQMPNAGAALARMSHAGLSPEQALASLANMVQGQSVMLATNQMFAFVVPALLGAALLIWITPKAELHGGGPGGGAH
jgi:MFS transporter, DHA2 family, multidrug resistance protein